MINLQDSKNTLLVVMTLIGLVVAEPLTGGENVCNITVPARKDIMVERPVSYEIEYATMCGILPCQKKKVETRLDQSLKVVLVHEVVTTCCKGYAETPERKCAPICLNACNNGGKCVAPGQCKCSPMPGEWTPGFVGPTCKRFICLGENHWGSKCDKECNCPLNAFCSANNGKCICYPGYRGANCTIECEPNSKHPECEDTNELPPIIEPDANLVMDNTISSRQRSEALVLERTPDETLQLDDRSSFGANYLVGVLACISLISLIGFLIVKRRYDRLKTEVCYSSGGSQGASSASGDYSTSDYYASQGSIASSAGAKQRQAGENMFSNNLSFAAATRQVLTGGAGYQKSNSNTQPREAMTRNRHDTHNKLVINPLIESRLVRNHKPAVENLYSDVEATRNFLDRPLPNPNQAAMSTSVNMTDEHIYQVPRSHGGGAANDSTLDNSGDSSSLYKSIAGEDEIYEELVDGSSSPSPDKKGEQQ